MLGSEIICLWVIFLGRYVGKNFLKQW